MSSLCLFTTQAKREARCCCGRKKRVLEGLASANRFSSPKRYTHNVCSNALVKESHRVASNYKWNKRERKPQNVCISLKTITATFKLNYLSKKVDSLKKKDEKEGYEG